MLRSCFVCFTLIAVCAQARAQSAPTAPATSAPSTAASAPTVPGVTASPESKAAAVPVDREALLSPADKPAPKHHDIESDPLFVPGAVLIGGGGAVLLASLFTGLGANGIYSSLEEDCKNNVCRPEDKHRIDSGKSLAVVSTVLTGVGVLAAGVGTVFMILAATHEEKPPATVNFGIAKLQLTGGPTPLGVGAAGSF